MKNRVGNRRLLVVSILFGILFSCFIVFGMQFTIKTVIDYSIGTLLALAIFTILFTAFFMLLLSANPTIKTDEKLKASKIRIFIVLTIITVIFLLASYPGNYCYDIISQQLAYKTGDYTTHFPPAFCFISGLIIDLGRLIFGSENGAVVFYILIQSTINNIIVAYIISELSGKIKNKTFRNISILYFIVHPFIFNLILSVCHDVLFGDVFILLLFELIKLSEDTTLLNSKKYYLKIFVLIFLLCITRNNGLFALIPMIVTGLIMLKKYRKKFLILTCIPLAVFAIVYQGIFFTVIKVKKENVLHESLNLPVLQIARSINYDKSIIMKENINQYFFDDCHWFEYSSKPAISDGYKVCLLDGNLDKDLFGFIGTWARIGLEHPDRYLEAPGIFALVMYYPWSDYSDDKSVVYKPYIEYAVRDASAYSDNNEIAKPKREPVIKELDKFLDSFFWKEQTWSKIPVLRLIWSAAFSVWLSLITLVFVIYKKSYKYLLPVSLIFGMLLTVFLSPVVIFRYMFPVILATPVMIYVIIRTIYHP